MTRAAAYPHLAVTQGDPSGIGPEVVLKLLPRIDASVRVTVYGFARGFEATIAAVGEHDAAVAATLGATWRGLLGGQTRHGFVECADAFVLEGATIAVSREVAPMGRVSAAGGAQAACAVVTAVRAVMGGDADAVVTAPLHKKAMHMAGVEAPGHTEIIGSLTGVAEPVMMLASKRLRTVPATIHVPLAEVPRLLTTASLLRIITVTDESLRELFGEVAPRIAVCGLNPHAGDDGRFGDEEARIIAPAIEMARAKGIDVFGPVAADGYFPRAVDGATSAVIGMYHDQALIPLKLLSMGHAVNVTLGVPIVRTSVDHGTAFDIAGRGVADEESLLQAAEMAVAMVRARVARRGVTP